MSIAHTAPGGNPNAAESGASIGTRADPHWRIGDRTGMKAAMLEQSAITPEIVEERGYRRVDAITVKLFGFKGEQAMPGIIIPIFGFDGSVVDYQLRPDKPRAVPVVKDGKPVMGDDGKPKIKPGPKYETPAGHPHYADVLPSMLPAALDLDTPIAITEGRKKADSVASVGIPCVALTSVTTWNTPGTRQLRPELMEIPWNGRRVLLPFDADAFTNKAVARELGKLTATLKGLGARVEVIAWPHGKGVDDFRAQGGDLRALIDGKPSEREIEDAWSACSELASRADILADFERHQRDAGIAGEGNVLRLIYLAVTSRLLDRPVSLVVKGPSSGGKSYLIESTLKAFPADAYHSFTGMSEKSLLYTHKDFRHRFLYVAEAAGVNSDFLDYLLRTLLSEHRLRYETVESVNGTLTPREIVKDGPTGLMMATTRAYLHPENETRLLSLRVNDSKDQTRDILRSIAGRGGPAPDYRTWQALQTWISGQDNRVDIPYAPTLSDLIPPVDVRIRRDFELLLNAIKAHAILHQATRERNDDGEIVATLDDYAAVRGLVGDVMSAAVATRVPPQLRTIVSAVKKLLDDDESASNRKIVEGTGFSKSQVNHWLKTAKGEGYLIDANEGQRGKSADLSIGAALPVDTDLLPTVEALSESWTPPEPPDGPGTDNAVQAHDTPHDAAPAAPGRGSPQAGAMRMVDATIDGREALEADVWDQVCDAFRGCSRAWDDDTRNLAALRLTQLRRDGLRDVARDVLATARHNQRRRRTLAEQERVYALVDRIRREAAEAEDPHRKGGFVRTLWRPGYQETTDDGHDVCVRAPWSPLIWDDLAHATPAGNVAGTAFLFRRIRELRASGHHDLARALRPMLPGRDERRAWRAAM